MTVTKFSDMIQASNEAQKTKKAVTPTKNEPPPIKKKGSYIIAQVKRNEKNKQQRNNGSN